jgi:5'/3'-nucleotidase
MRILITNDDGVQAPGLFALKQALDPIGEVTVVAPDRPRSACGHSITLHKPLRVAEARLADGSRAFTTTGTPSDCVTLAILDVMQGREPDLVVSGINQGPNLGWDLTYSGTVSAAMEAAIMNFQAFAVSVAWRLEPVHSEDGEPGPRLDFGPAARFCAVLARRLASHPLPRHTLLNVNVPTGEPPAVEVTRQGVRRYPGKVEKRVDPTGRPYYWLGGDQPEDRLEEGTDVHAIARGHISVTPIQLDLTDHPVVRELSKWDFAEYLAGPGS